MCFSNGLAMACRWQSTIPTRGHAGRSAVSITSEVGHCSDALAWHTAHAVQSMSTMLWKSLFWSGSARMASRILTARPQVVLYGRSRSRAI